MRLVRRRVRPFIIVFPGRSGGTFLATSLSTHPQIRVKTEPMGLLAPKGADVQDQWTRRFLRGPITGPTRIGMSTKVADLCDPERMTALLRECDTSVLALDRRNAVKLTVSIIRARQLRETTGRWNRFSPDVAMGSTELDPEEFDRRLIETVDRRGETLAFVDTLSLPTLRLDYADLLTDPTAALARTCDFLEVAPRPIESQTFKNTSDNLSEAILNFTDLRSRYVGTPFEAMFDEILTG